MMKLREEPGWYGMFMRDQAVGAIPNGARIEKALCEPGDAHPAGTPGTVLGSFHPPKPVPGYATEYWYFVEWDCNPRVACGVMDFKIRRLPSERAQAMLERVEAAALAEAQRHLDEGREVHGRRDGQPVVIKPKKP